MTATGPSNRPVSSTGRAPANLIALAARFVTICSTRRRSPVAARRRGGALTWSRTPRSSAIGRRPADTALRASATENGSKLERERAGLEARELQQVVDQRRHRVRRSCARAPGTRVRPRRRRRDHRGSGRDSRTGRSSGVRSSWATVDTKRARSVFRRAQSSPARVPSRGCRSPGPGPLPRRARGRVAGVARGPRRRSDSRKLNPSVTSPADGIGQAGVRRGRPRIVDRSRRRAGGTFTTVGDAAAAQRDGDRAPASRPRAARDCGEPPNRARSPGRSRHRRSVGPDGGDGDAARGPIGDDGRAFGADGLRQEVEQPGQPLLRGIVAGQDIQGAGQQPPFLAGDAVAPRAWT